MKMSCPTDVWILRSQAIFLKKASFFLAGKKIPCWCSFSLYNMQGMNFFCHMFLGMEISFLMSYGKLWKIINLRLNALICQVFLVSDLFNMINTIISKQNLRSIDIFLFPSLTLFRLAPQLHPTLNTDFHSKNIQIQL